MEVSNAIKVNYRHHVGAGDGTGLLAEEATPPAKMPLRILYAGNKGSDRENFTCSWASTLRK